MLATSINLGPWVPRLSKQLLAKNTPQSLLYPSFTILALSGIVCCLFCQDKNRPKFVWKQQKWTWHSRPLSPLPMGKRVWSWCLEFQRSNFTDVNKVPWTFQPWIWAFVNTSSSPVRIKLSLELRVGIKRSPSVCHVTNQHEFDPADFNSRSVTADVKPWCTRLWTSGTKYARVLLSCETTWCSVRRIGVLVWFSDRKNFPGFKSSLNHQIFTIYTGSTSGASGSVSHQRTLVSCSQRFKVVFSFRGNNKMKPETQRHQSTPKAAKSVFKRGEIHQIFWNFYLWFLSWPDLGSKRRKRKRRHRNTKPHPQTAKSVFIWASVVESDLIFQVFYSCVSWPCFVTVSRESKGRRISRTHTQTRTEYPVLVSHISHSLLLRSTLTHSFPLSCALNHSFTHSLTQVHSLIHLHTHSHALLFLSLAHRENSETQFRKRSKIPDTFFQSRLRLALFYWSAKQPAANRMRCSFSLFL